MAEKRGPVTPRDAATVILIRETKPLPFEVFLMRRHSRQTFMGNAHVFPGGALDEADLDPELSGVAAGLGPAAARARLREPKLSDQMALGLYFAAIRETFEESGIFMGEALPGKGNGQAGPVTSAPLGCYREPVHDGQMSLKKMAMKEGLRLSLDQLTPYSRWITPVIEKKRFDARFFLARMPDGQTGEHDAVEMTASIWMTPAQAVETHYAGGLKLMPPTLVLLEEMMGFGRVSEWWDDAARREIKPILPQVYRRDGRVGLLLPNDPEYTLESYKAEPAPLAKTRLYITDRGWITARHDE